jgi:hypothetical protein
MNRYCVQRPRLEAKKLQFSASDFASVNVILGHCVFATVHAPLPPLTEDLYCARS